MMNEAQQPDDIFVQTTRSLDSERYGRFLQTLYCIAKKLSEYSVQTPMLTEALALLERELNMQRTAVMLLSPNGEELHIEAANNIAPHRREHIRYQRGEGIIGRVLQNGQYAIVPRIAHEPEFQNRIHTRNIEQSHDLSFICVPIAISSEVVGTLSADVPFADMLTLQEYRRLISIVASMIAFDVKARRQASLERRSMEAEHLRLRSALGEQFRPENIIGNSNAMRKVYERIHQVSQSDATVLIRGESGTGKELVASAIHYSSLRASKPFIRVNCSALNEQLIESELFGHERGAFTGALNTRKGRIEEAEGGTLFLDEIGDVSLSTQVKLLRVIQEREFERVGNSRTLKANIRILAATNKILEEQIQTGQFRDDLFYRINVFQISLPPLRQRKDDILQLADRFVEKYSCQMNKPIERISTTAINMMTAYHWPGNVRELENCIEHAVVLSQDGVIHGRHLPPTLQMPTEKVASTPTNMNDCVQQLETDMIVDAMKLTDGNIAAAARHLGVTPRMIRYKIEKYSIQVQTDYPKEK